MPIKDISFTNEDSKIGIWKITETVSELIENLHLTSLESHSFSLFKNEKRKLEWLAIRCLLQEMDKNASVVYMDNGKPKLEKENGFVSLSHTKGWVSVVLNYKHCVGCDIEQLSPKVIRIKDKFASDLEQDKSSNYNNKVVYYTLIWSAKEAIYKMYSDIISLEFKTQINIELPSSLKVQGTLKAIVQLNEEQKLINLNYQIHSEYVLVYSLND